MLDAISSALAGEEAMLRQLEPQWNRGMIAASIAISLLGAFTSTQLMCQARVSLRFSSVLAWTILGSLTFGFCSIWSLHFVAMLACELDLPIGIDVPLTLLSSVLAVFFTFAALASDLLWQKYNRERKITTRSLRRKGPISITQANSTMHLLDATAQEDDDYNHHADLEPPSSFDLLQELHHELEEDPLLDAHSPTASFTRAQPELDGDSAQRILASAHDNVSYVGAPTKPSARSPEPRAESPLPDNANSRTGFTEQLHRTLTNGLNSRRSSTSIESNAHAYGLNKMLNIGYRSKSPVKNGFIATGEALYAGCTFKNILKGLLWSLAITSMHYVGIAALRIPNGHFKLDPILVISSGLISWVVCLVGCILMSQMETHLTRQVLFSVVATTGVAAMHFTGMRAATFWSYALPSEARGYPPALAVAIVSIAITTCILANGLLAHAATVSRNKLAEIVWTRRKLWRTIAQKENAEAAAAARSDFIASASHEIRTPLHHLQGYSDLLSRTELTDEGRVLLGAIQRATKTLSLITNNVLDWSKLERETEAKACPVALDMRTVCESILVLLPNKDDEAEVELMGVVTPNVPHSLFLDETYIYRILMNLLSNALKFTRSGYILLLIDMDKNKLIATVKDTGLGIPPSFLPQLFEPFKQAQTRGSQRGTGLGLSITEKLVHKMGGTIEVVSTHPETEGFGPGPSGSTFTITIPMQLSSIPLHKVLSTEALPRIAIFYGDNERSLQGLRTAWEKFEFDVVMVEEFSDLAGSEWKYVWADTAFLKQRPSLLDQLLKPNHWLVLVPYDTQSTIQDVPGLLSAPHFVPLQRPLMWHSFQQRIAVASQRSDKAAPASTVSFAPKVNILNGTNNEQQREESTTQNLVVLLVEDNPINQRLGKKMLTSLGYQVMIAEDGQDAIEQVIEHDTTVDAILMDQSMPRKDGIAATREIRAMEAAGKLSRRRPIIAATAVVNAQAEAQFKSAGADDFLAKPLSLDRLEQTLAAHLPAKWR